MRMNNSKSQTENRQNSNQETKLREEKHCRREEQSVKPQH